MKLLALCLFALTVGGKADGGLDGLVYAPGHASADYYSYPAYAFEYAVKDPHTGDNKAQWEKRDGDVVKGAYSLVEPDGRVRVVEYYADDKTGFNAVVKRLGPNLHPTGPAPIYKAEIPVLSHGPAIPITVGPVAELKGLSAAPLISGPIHGGAISSAAIYKAPTVKVAPAPIISQPIIVKEPLWQGPLIKEQIPLGYGHGPLLGLEKGPIGLEKGLIGGPISHGPLLGLEKGPYGLEKGIIGLEKGPYLGPLIKEGPYLPGPIYKSGPILGPSPWDNGHGPILSGAPLYKTGPLVSEPWLQKPIYKSAPYLEPINLWGKGDIGQIGPIGLELNHGLLNKGLLSGYGWEGPKH